MIGTIIKGIGGFYYVKIDDKVIECKARGKFRYKELAPVVGDKVDIEVSNDKGVIEKIHERKSYLIRPTVANVTQAFVVFAAKSPDINFDLLNNFLALCEYNHVKAVICINKIDLCSKEEFRDIKNTFENIGYEVIDIKAKEGYNVDVLKEMLKDNVTVLCGPSGAGKSTLMNSLSGRTLMETGEISEKLKRGKHTTRHSELIDMEEGFLVDTPGFSNIDISFIEEDELKNCFPEFHEYEGRCKFSTCSHNKEPKCAIKDAVEAGKINSLRYKFYIRTLEEIRGGRKRR